MRTSILALCLYLTPLAAIAATNDNWTNNGHDSSWSTSLNWSNGLPGSSSAVIISTQPQDNIVGVDTGTVINTIDSFSFASTLTAGVQVLPAGVEQLQVSSSVSNTSSFAQTFGLYVGLTGSLLQSGSAGLTFAGGLGLTQAVTNANSGLITLGSDAPFVLTLGASTGKLTTSGTLGLNGSDLVFNTATTYANGTALTLLTAAARTGHFGAVSFAGAYTGDFTQTSAGIWTAVVGGQTWQFVEATGVLSNVPEPSAGLLLAMGGLLVGRRNRRGRR